MPFKIVREDITAMQVDAIVNAANTDLQMGGGVCGAIFKAAGQNALQESCNQVGPINTGEAVITPGFALPAKYIIHTAGPIYQNYSPEESEALLRACYRNALNLALEHDLESIAFPLISSGIYGYPKDEAIIVAISEIQTFLEANEMSVYLTIFGKQALPRKTGLRENVSKYILEHFEPSGKNILVRRIDRRTGRESIEEFISAPVFESLAPKQALTTSEEIEDRLTKLEDSFATQLLHLIDSKGKTDVEVYKRANMDRKLFSKIRTTKHYLPSKRNIIALAIALELDLDETQDLLNRAGYALSNSQYFDVVIEYFIVNKKYDIYDINEVLFAFDLPLLGA